jgi:hypothetical protein
LLAHYSLVLSGTRTIRMSQVLGLIISAISLTSNDDLLRSIVL